MLANKHWKLLAVLSALLLTSACGSDSKKNSGSGDGDGDHGDSGPSGDGDKGDGGSNVTPILADGAAGKTCKKASDCGSDAKAQCATTLTGGTIASFLGQQAGISTSLAVPDGYCSAACTDDKQCGSGGACLGAVGSQLSGILSVILGGGAGGIELDGECRKSCTKDGDCGDGQECAKLNNSALPSGVSMYSGLLGGSIPSTCQPKPTPVPITDDIVGKPCSSDSECGPGTCQTAAAGLGGFFGGGGGAAAAADAGGPTGTCTSTCVKDSDCGSSEGTCTPGFYGSGGTCAEKCATSADCKVTTDNCTSNLCVPSNNNNKTDAGTSSDTDASTPSDTDAG
jgi:hypothetical protein